MLLTNLAIKYRASVFLLMIVITIFGSVAYVTLPKESTPDVQIPLLIVTTIYSGVSPADMESLVTLPLETKLKGLKGVKKISTYSSEGVANITIEFLAGVDIDAALQKVKDKVDQAKRDLPTDLTEDPIVLEISTSDFPVMILTVSGDVPEKDLKKIADNLKDDIEGVRGVLEVNLSGARDREIVVEFNYLRLQAYNLSINQIAQAIQTENVNIPGGSMDIGQGKYLLRIPGTFTDPKQINDIVLTTFEGRPVYIKDVATVSDTFEDKDSYASLNGQDAISLSVKKRSGDNIIDMATGVREVIDRTISALPPAVKITIVTDTSENIIEMVHELENHLMTGLILVVLVLFFFLGKTNSIFTALAIPFSMLMSFIIFAMLGMTINMVVLFSLIMALGMLVDDAIVIVENIFRHMQQGMGRVEAAIAASDEVGWPVIAATITKVFAFLPLLFWSGVVGEFMGYIPKTLIITLLSSLFVALVFNPVICATFMRVRPDQIRATDEEHFGKFMQFYIRTVHFALNHRFKAIIISIFFVILPMFLYSKSGLGMEFFPESDPAQSYFRANGPQGTSAITTRDMLRIIDNATKGEKDIEMILSEVGGGAAEVQDMGGTVTHLGRVTVQFITFADRKESSTDVTNRIRDRLSIFPGAELVVEKPKMGPPTGDPISVEISGEDVLTLGRIADEVKAKIVKIPGLVDLKDDLVKSKPEIRINVDREKAALLGLSTQAIALSVRGSIYGLLSGKYREGDDEYDIKVRLPESERMTIDDVKNLRISTPTGDYVPISSLGEVVLASGFGTITRYDFKRVVNVTANVDGRSSIQVLNDVRAILKDHELPSGYKISYTGETEDQQEASRFLITAFSVAIFLILMVLLVEFNSVAQSMIILFTVILSLGGIFWGLLITHTSFGIMMTGIGTISLAGVVVNNGIIMIDYTNRLHIKGYSIRNSVVHAGAVRFRPVLLTAVTAILGLLPMAIGYGFSVRNFTIEKGAEMSQWWVAMANAVIFGLAFATVLTLVIVPVLYSFTKGGLQGDMRDDITFKTWLFGGEKKDIFND